MRGALPPLLALAALHGSLAVAAGDPARGEQAFRACAVCHSVQPGEHLTGPSLADVVGRKAGTAPGFNRYSDALKRSGLAWDEPTLDRWLAGPARLVPGTAMTFPGVAQAQTRQNLIAYLKAVAAPGAGTGTTRPRPSLKNPPPEGLVRSIKYCGDTYTIETADGQAEKIWEFNLRLKTDSSKLGPEPGKPVAIGAGMHGDRTTVVFASPGEISAFIQKSCP